MRKINTLFITLSFVALLSACGSGIENDLEQVKPIETSNNLPKQKVVMNVAGDISLNPVTENISDNELRGLKFNIKKDKSQNIKVKVDADLKVLMILRCKDTPSLPIFYKVITCGLKQSDATTQHLKFKGQPLEFEWNGATTFEQIKNQNWETMFFLSKDIASIVGTSNKELRVGSKQNNLNLYDFGQDVEVNDIDIPFFSDWQPVTFRQNQQNSATTPLYTIQVGGHTELKPKGIVTRVYFDNKIILPIDVKGFKVESNAYAFEGTFDLSEATLKSNNFQPKYKHQDISASPFTNLKNEKAFLKNFTIGTLPIAKTTVADKGVAFWMMPTATAPTQPYTQIYLNAEASVAGKVTTNANGNVANDTYTALNPIGIDGGTINHGIVANTPLAKQVPSIKCLPVYTSTKAHQGNLGKSVSAVLKIQRPKICLEYIAETPICREYNPQIDERFDFYPSGQNPVRGTLGFSTDLRFSDKSTNLYNLINGQIVETEYLKEGHLLNGNRLSKHDIKSDRVHLDFSVAENLSNQNGYHMPESRAYFAYTTQSNAPDYMNRTSVEIDNSPQKEYYKARYTGTEPATPVVYDSYVSPVKEINGNRVTYAMHYVQNGVKKYRVVARYVHNPGKRAFTHCFAAAQSPYSSGRIMMNGYQSVTMRYIGENYLFGELADAAQTWANEDFWKQNNDDDLVRYYPLYGYAVTKYFYRIGDIGLYWIKDIGKKTIGYHKPTFSDVFYVREDGFLALNDANDHSYCLPGDDMIPVIPVTDKDWGQ